MEKIEFCRPEEVGVSSQYINAFLERIKEKKICLHSFLMMRYGKIIAEGYFKPYNKDSLQRMYSVSKTFVAIAIGLLIDEGRLSLEDKIVDFFPDKLPKKGVDDYIKDTTVYDLLTMAGPFGKFYPNIQKESDWIECYFKNEPSHPPGTVFFYDTGGTRVLTAIVERLTKKPFLEYLKDKMLREIGFSENSWCIKTPEGYSHGGSGVMATTRDLALFAGVLLNKGELNGKRYISKEFIEDAIRPHIFNNVQGEGLRTNKGYGYQIWCMENGGFTLKGMGSQQAICIPDKDFIFVCTGDTQGSKLHYEAIYDYLYFEIVEKLNVIPQAKNINVAEKNKGCCIESSSILSGETYKDANNCQLDSTFYSTDLTFETLDGKCYSKIQEDINGVVFDIGKNPMGISKLSLIFEKNNAVFRYTNLRGEKEIHFGMGHYVESLFPETHYNGEIINKPAGRMYRCMSCGTWFNDHQLVIRTYIIDNYLGNLTITIGFKNNQIGLRMHKTAESFLDDYEGFAGGTSKKQSLEAII